MSASVLEFLPHPIRRLLGPAIVVAGIVALYTLYSPRPETAWSLLDARKSDLVNYTEASLVISAATFPDGRKQDVWSARLHVNEPNLTEAAARAVAADYIERQGTATALRFSVLGMTEQQGIPIAQVIFHVRCAASPDAARAIQRPQWVGGDLPKVEFLRQ